jgi:formylglycine-generating enzyme required for sulfatase activity
VPLEAAPPPKLEVTPKSQSAIEPAPIVEPKSKPGTKSKPKKEREPAPAPGPAPKPQPNTKPEPTITPEPVRQPSRSAAGIRTILFSVIGLAVLAIAGYVIFGRGSNLPTPTTAVSTEISLTSTSPVPTAAPSLPTAIKMVPVPAGAYRVGKDPANPNYVAPRTVDLTSFWIDQYETTNAEYQRFLNETAASPPVVWPSPPGAEKYPVRGVTWDQADDYCRWMNKRLPDEAEWEAAGRGRNEDPPRLYPWEDPNRTFELSQQLNELYAVGTLSFNGNPLGVFDMVGNVWEWVGEPYGNLEAGKRILRGGRYSFPQDLAYRVQVAPDDPIYLSYAGFRCAADEVR